MWTKQQMKVKPFWKTKPEQNKQTNKIMGASNSLKQLLLAETSAGVPRAESPEVVADPKQNREYLHVRVHVHHVTPTILRGEILAVPTTFFFPLWLLCVCVCVCVFSQPRA